MSKKILTSQALDEYHIHMNCFLYISEIRNVFYTYLASESNQEPLEFINLVYTMKRDDSEKDIQVFMEICNTFIENWAPKQINISGSTRIDILSSKNTKTWQTKPFDVLKPATNSIINDLIYDSFPRFIRSPCGEKIIVKYLDHPKVAELSNTRKYPYVIEDFYVPFVLEKDELFIQALLQDGFEWDLVYQSNGRIHTYTSKRNYFPNIKDYNFHVHKTDIILDIPLEVAILSLGPETTYHEWDPNSIKTEVVHTFSREEISEKWPNLKYTHNCDAPVLAIHLNFPFPVNTRRILPYSPGLVIPDPDTFIIIAKPYLNHEFLGLDKRNGNSEYYQGKKVIVMPNMSAYCYVRLSESKVRFTQLHCCDLRGWSGLDFIEKLTLKKRSEDLWSAANNYSRKQLANKKLEDFAFLNRRSNLESGKYGKFGQLLHSTLNWNEIENPVDSERISFLQYIS